LLTARNLDVFYGRLQAVRNVSFRVEQGQLVTLLGANGAGKTSIIRAVAGLVRIPAGCLDLDGHDLHSLRSDQRVALGIGTVPEGRELFRSLTVEENLKVGAYRRHNRSEIAADLDWIDSRFPALRAKRKQGAGSLSGGQGQMLAIGRALMTRPRLLLLDEPSHGLAPILVEEIFALIPRLQAEHGLSILLVEQTLRLAARICGRAYLMQRGRIVGTETSDELARSARRVYLAGS